MLYICRAISINAFNFSLCLFRAWYRSQLRQTTEGLRALPQSGLKSHAKTQSFGLFRKYVDNGRPFFGEGRTGFGIEVLRYTFFPDRDKTISYQHA